MWSVRYVVAVLASFAILWACVAVALVAVRPRGLRLRDAALLMPEVVLLVRDLARDRSIPRHVRAWVWLLLAWMVSPVDVIPDVIPVVGVVDDVVLAYVVLRSVARAAGPEVLEQHWRGSTDGLRALERLLRLEPGRVGRRTTAAGRASGGRHRVRLRPPDSTPRRSRMSS